MQEYQISKLLGHGSFAQVHLCVKDGQQYAIKIVKNSSEQLQFVQNGAKYLKLLGEFNNPAIVKYIDHVQDDQEFGLVMELLNGTELYDYLLKHFVTYDKATMGIPVSNVVQIMTQLIQALSFIHGLGISHGDVKLENIMVILSNGNELKIKLIDFGLAAASNQIPFRGSEPYLSPETVMGLESRTGEKCDIWAAGVVMFVILFGRMPFELDKSKSDYHRSMLRKIAMGSVELKDLEKEYLRQVDGDLEKVLFRLLERDPTKRSLKGLEMHP